MKLTTPMQITLKTIMESPKSKQFRRFSAHDMGVSVASCKALHNRNLLECSEYVMRMPYVDKWSACWIAIPCVPPQIWAEIANSFPKPKDYGLAYNMNAEATVELTPKGEGILRQYWKEFDIDPLKGTSKTYTTELWRIKKKKE
jgi:hypothetical protein